MRLTGPAERMRHKEKTMMNARIRTAAFALSLALAMALTAAPALATQSIDSFSSTISSTLAGDHPDIETHFTLHDPGAPEAARNVIFNAPEGIFGNPQAVIQCISS